MVGIKYILCALGGAAVGAGVTAAILEKRHKEFVEDTLKAVKKTRDSLVEVKAATEKLNWIDPDNDGGLAAMREEAEKYKNLYFESLRKDYVTESAYEEKKPPVSLAPEEEPLSEMGAYVITIADFMDDPKYEKVYCEYYRATGTLVNTMTDECLDVKLSLGEMWEILEGWVGSEIYIRNVNTGVDYQIDFLPGAFKEDTGS